MTNKVRHIGKDGGYSGVPWDHMWERFKVRTLVKAKKARRWREHMELLAARYAQRLEIIAKHAEEGQ